MLKLKVTPEKTKNSWSPWSQSGRWKGRRTMEERIFGREVLSLEWKREGVMDGDSCDEGNDELTCVRSDKSDKSAWSAGRRRSTESWCQRQGDTWRKERLLTFREEEEDDEIGWRHLKNECYDGAEQMRLYRYESWAVVRTSYVRKRIL